MDTTGLFRAAGLPPGSGTWGAVPPGDGDDGVRIERAASISSPEQGRQDNRPQRPLSRGRFQQLPTS
jgi:hypothetical protein